MIRAREIDDGQEKTETTKRTASMMEETTRSSGRREKRKTSGSCWRQETGEAGVWQRNRKEDAESSRPVRASEQLLDLLTQLNALGSQSLRQVRGHSSLALQLFHQEVHKDSRPGARDQVLHQSNQF